MNRLRSFRKVITPVTYVVHSDAHNHKMSIKQDENLHTQKIHIQKTVCNQVQILPVIEDTTYRS